MFGSCFITLAVNHVSELSFFFPHFFFFFFFFLFLSLSPCFCVVFQICLCVFSIILCYTVLFCLLLFLTFSFSASSVRVSDWLDVLHGRFKHLAFAIRSLRSFHCLNVGSELSHSLQQRTVFFFFSFSALRPYVWTVRSPACRLY